jgi:hypothetical protein
MTSIGATGRSRQHNNNGWVGITPVELPPSIPEGARLDSGISSCGSGNNSPATMFNEVMLPTTPMQMDRFISSPFNTILSTLETSSQPQICPLCGHQLPQFGSWNIPTQSRKISPGSALGAGRVDPFSSLPVKTNSNAHFLVDHCKLKLLLRVSVPVPGIFQDGS